jgi:SPASM domain peptide maturase of grasp-with-spasm system
MANHHFFRLFACCVPVKGARRSVVCDIQRGSYFFIPNGLYEILTEHGGKTLEAIRAAYGPEDHATIDQYFAYLEEKEAGFWCDDPSRFPALDLSWEAPERISNAIIDVGPEFEQPFAELLAQLDDLGCQAVQVRFFRRCTLLELEALLGACSKGRLRSVEILVAHTPELSPSGLESVCRAHPRLLRLTVYGAPMTEIVPLRGLGVSIWYLEDKLDSPACCGEVHPAYFVANIQLFSEAQRFNTCLNRKLSVDQHGYIRNCPSMPKSHGHVRDTSLHAALARREFRDLWQVNKDQIDVCRDCEFRYICTDCRAYIAEPQDRFSKPSKCTYDPYAAKW